MVNSFHHIPHFSLKTIDTGLYLILRPSSEKNGNQGKFSLSLTKNYVLNTLFFENKSQQIKKLKIFLVSEKTSDNVIMWTWTLSYKYHKPKLTRSHCCIPFLPQAQIFYAAATLANIGVITWYYLSQQQTSGPRMFITLD